MNTERVIRVLLVGSSDAAAPEFSPCGGTVVVGRTESGAEAQAAATALSPDAVLVLADDAAPEADIPDTIRSLAEMGPLTAVVLITRNAVRHLVPAIKAGAAGIISPEANLEELLPTLCRTDQRVAFPPSPMQRCSTQSQRHPGITATRGVQHLVQGYPDDGQGGQHA